MQCVQCMSMHVCFKTGTAALNKKGNENGIVPLVFFQMNELKDGVRKQKNE